MNEKTSLTKTPEKKAQVSLSKKPNENHSKSIDSPAEQILQMQQTLGNHAVQRLIESGVIQAKLKIGRPNDKYEQEADHIAERVIRMPEPQLQRQSGCPDCPDREEIQTKPLDDQITPFLQRQFGSEEEEESIQPKLIQRQKKEEEEPIQAKQANNQTPLVNSTIESGIQSLKGGGQPLPESTRTYFEPRFGTDFSQVRVHIDSRAALMNKELGARAFTNRQNIYFQSGQYHPNSIEGKRLLAHELVHVQQQQASERRPTSILCVRSTHEPLEREGECTTASVEAPASQQLSRPAPLLHVEPTIIQRFVGSTNSPGVHSEDRFWEWRYVAESVDDEILISIIVELELNPNIRRSDALILRTEAHIRDLSDQIVTRIENQLEGNWHTLLPESHMSPTRVVRGPRNLAPEVRRNPHEGPGRLAPGDPRITSDPQLQYPVEAPVGPEPTPERPLFAEARQRFLREMSARLAAIPVPTATGSLRLALLPRERERGLGYRGYQWTRGRDLPRGAARESYQTFWQDVQNAETPVEAQELSINLNDPEDNKMWEMYREITSREGDIASINTYDSERLTIGTGFSARWGHVQWIYAQMPEEFHRLLYNYGIFLDPQEGFVVLDEIQGEVERGDAALMTLQVDQRRLSLLINTASSDEPMADVSGQQAPTRQLMLRAQFERFKYIHRNARGVLLSWDRNPLLFAFRLHHGRPTLLPWRNLIRQGRNNVRNIAVYAFRRLGGTNEAWDLLRRVAQRANVDDDDIGPMPLP